jgi:hypothetical protein
MLPAVFETAITAKERTQTHALDSAVSGIGGIIPQVVYIN